MTQRSDKFSEHARRVLTYAQQESQTLGHDFIGPEHLLLGLLRDDESSAVRVLARLGVDAAKIREQVLLLLDGPESGAGPSGAIGLTPDAKRVIESAVDEVRRASGSGIRSAHLLLGVARVEDTIAAGVLQSLGVTLDRLREEVAAVWPPAPARAPEPSADPDAYDDELETLRSLRIWFDRVVQSGPGAASDIAAMLLRDVDELLPLIERGGTTNGRLLELIGRLTAGSRALAIVASDGDEGAEVRPNLEDVITVTESLAKRFR